MLDIAEWSYCNVKYQGVEKTNPELWKPLFMEQVFPLSIYTFAGDPAASRRKRRNFLGLVMSKEGKTVHLAKIMEGFQNA